MAHEWRLNLWTRLVHVHCIAVHWSCTTQELKEEIRSAIYGFWCNSRVNSRAYPLVPGSVAEMSEPNRREGMMDSLKPSGIAVPVTLAALEPTVSKLVRV